VILAEDLEDLALRPIAVAGKGVQSCLSGCHFRPWSSFRAFSEKARPRLDQGRNPGSVRKCGSVRNYLMNRSPPRILAAAERALDRLSLAAMA
jgi:hypothetical protein